MDLLINYILCLIHHRNSYIIIKYYFLLDSKFKTKKVKRKLLLKIFKNFYL